MSKSIRQQIKEAIVTAVSSIAVEGLDNYVTVYQDDNLPQSLKTDGYGLVVDWSDDSAQALTMDRDEDTCSYQIQSLLRSAERDDERLDDLMVKAHAALMADRTLGGLAYWITRRGASRSINYSDKVYQEITHHYDVTFRHQSADLTAA